MSEQSGNDHEHENESGAEQQPGPEQPAAEHEVGAEQPTTEQPTGAEPPTTEQPTGAEPPTTEQPPTSQAPGPRRLYRSRNDRVLAGVCGGIARYFNIDPVLVRVGAVALVFLGGAGLLAYIAAVLLVPNEGEDGGPAEGPNRAMAIAGVVLLVIAVCVLLPFRGWDAGWGILPLGLLALAGLFVWRLASGQRPEGDARAILRGMALGVALIVACAVLAFSAAWATAAGGNGVVAGIVIAAGIALIAGAFAGQWARWLILPALAVALPAGVVAAADIDVKGGYGEKTYRPASLDAVRDSYRLGAGHLVVDLRRANLTPGDHRIKLRVGVGEADLIVPRGVCVSTDAHLGIGGVNVFDTTNGGIDHDWTDERDALPGNPRVVLDGDVGIGAVTVHHRPYEHWETEVGNGACV
jgi:phage shock protein PspC (stress-responsive transcriptional regulator)